MTALADVVRSFAQLVAERQDADLDNWIAQVRNAELVELEPFLAGLEQDRVVLSGVARRRRGRWRVSMPHTPRYAPQASELTYTKRARLGAPRVLLGGDTDRQGATHGDTPPPQPRAQTADADIARQ